MEIHGFPLMAINGNERFVWDQTSHFPPLKHLENWVNENIKFQNVNFSMICGVISLSNSIQKMIIKISSSQNELYLKPYF